MNWAPFVDLVVTLTYFNAVLSATTTTAYYSTAPGDMVAKPGQC
jgi:hypothetical protein